MLDWASRMMLRSPRRSMSCIGDQTLRFSRADSQGMPGVGRARRAELLRPLCEHERAVGEAGSEPRPTRCSRGMLTRLRLTAIRDQPDNLLDEAAKRELTPSMKQGRNPSA